MSSLTSKEKMKDMSIIILKLWKFKFFIWPQRSTFTSEVKGQFNKKLRTWSKKLREKVLVRYLTWLLSYMRLKPIFWPQRSSLTSKAKGHIDIKLRTWSTSWWKKNDADTLSFLELLVFKVFILISEVKFDLGGQRSSKILYQRGSQKKFYLDT